MIRCLELNSGKGVKELRDDTNIQLAMRLERRLQCEMQLCIRVHVCEDQMQLLGTVASWYQKQQAQETARDVAPEYRIRNDLRVSGTAGQ